MEYFAHYHGERNHQGLDNELIAGSAPATCRRSRSSARIGGLDCVGDSAVGCSQHGQGRAITQGFIAGIQAGLEKSST